MPLTFPLRRMHFQNNSRSSVAVLHVPNLVECHKIANVMQNFEGQSRLIAGTTKGCYEKHVTDLFGNTVAPAREKNAKGNWMKAKPHMSKPGLLNGVGALPTKLTLDSRIF